MKAKSIIIASALIAAAIVVLGFALKGGIEIGRAHV